MALPQSRAGSSCPGQPAGLERDQCWLLAVHLGGACSTPAATWPHEDAALQEHNILVHGILKVMNGTAGT